MSEGNGKDWVVVFSTGTDYEASLVRDRLDDSGLDAVILAHRDHAFNLNVGKLSVVEVLVASHQVTDALAVLGSVPFTDEELTAAAMSADPVAHRESDASNEQTDE